MRNPLSIEAFADWCERQPAGRAYELGNTKSCAIGLYARSLGLPGATFTFEVDLGDGRHADLFGEDNIALVWNVPHTFGALAKRLREASSHA